MPTIAEVKPSLLLWFHENYFNSPYSISLTINKPSFLFVVIWWKENNNLKKEIMKPSYFMISKEDIIRQV